MTPRRHSPDPEPGHPIILDDGSETRVRQVLASDDRLGIYEVRDDRGQIIFISQTLAYNVWAQTEV